MPISTVRTGWLVLWAVGMLLLLPATVATAHGVTVEHSVAQTAVVSFTATYDSGEPMAGAQVAIFAPDDPLTPWQTGTCDATGSYRFVPDPALVGTWEVQVRQAGHGTTAYIAVGEAAASPTASSLQGESAGYTPLQLVAMGGAVVWGCVGTALFFARRRG